MPQYSENRFINALLSLPGLNLGRRRDSFRDARAGNPWAALGTVMPWAYDPQHDGNLLQNAGRRVGSVADGFGDALGSVRDMFSGGDGFVSDRRQAGFDDFLAGLGRGGTVDDQTQAGFDAFSNTLAGRQIDPRRPGNSARGGSSSRGTGSLGQHAGVIEGPAAVDAARSLAGQGLSAQGGATDFLNAMARRMAK